MFNVQTGCVLVVITLGAVGLLPRGLAEEENNRIQKPSLFFNDNFVATLQVHTSIVNIQKEIEDIFSFTNSGFDAVLRQIEVTRKNLKIILEQSFKKLQLTFWSKAAQEVQKVQSEGKDIENIVECLDNQSKFQKELTISLKTSAKCINKVSQNAKNSVKVIKTTYFESVLKNIFRGRKIIEKSEECVQSMEGVACVQEMLKVMQTKITVIFKESKKQLEIANIFAANQGIQSESCRKNVEKNMEVLKLKFNKIVEMCVKLSDKDNKSIEENSIN